MDRIGSKEYGRQDRQEQVNVLCVSDGVEDMSEATLRAVVRQDGDQPPTLSRAGAWAINLRSRQGTSNLTHYNGLDMTDGGQACILSGRGTSGWNGVWWK